MVRLEDLKSTEDRFAAAMRVYFGVSIVMFGEDKGLFWESSEVMRWSEKRIGALEGYMGCYGSVDESLSYHGRVRECRVLYTFGGEVDSGKVAMKIKQMFLDEGIRVNVFVSHREDVGLEGIEYFADRNSLFGSRPSGKDYRYPVSDADVDEVVY